MKKKFRKEKKAKRKERYFGIVKLPKGIKLCWLSKQSKHGWSLGLALNKRTVWVTGLRFVNKKELARALGANVVFIQMKNNPEE